MKMVELFVYFGFNKDLRVIFDVKSILTFGLKANHEQASHICRRRQPCEHP